MTGKKIVKCDSMDVCPLTKSSEKGHSTIIEGVEDVKQIQICKKKKKKKSGGRGR